MLLSPADEKLVFSVLAFTDFHTNKRTNLMPDICSPERMMTASMEGRKRLRDALWKDFSILDELIQDNPYRLTPEQLEVAHGFRHVTTGTFVIERCLKDHAIFVEQGQKGRVFAVHGLTQPIEDIVLSATGGKHPLMVQCALLPFRGRIIWDGLISIYPVHFGAGTRSRLKDIYQRAKERGEIITSLLGPGHPPPASKRASKDWSGTVQQVVEATEALGKPDTALGSAAFRLLKLSAQLAAAAVATPLDLELAGAQAEKAQRAMNAVIKAIQRDWD